MPKTNYEINSTVLKGCINQKRKSQETLYKTYYAYSMSVCLRYAKNRDDAVDIMNDSFIKVFENIKKYDIQKPFTAWLRAILINTAIDKYRRFIRHNSQIIYNDTDNFAVDTEPLNNLEFKDIQLLLNELPEQQRLIFNLHEIEGYSHKEIADKLNIAEGTSKGYLAVAKQILRNKYSQYYMNESKKNSSKRLRIKNIVNYE